MTEFTIRMASDMADKLDGLAIKMDCSSSFLASQAIEEFVSREAWQVAEIEAGLAEANRREFASEAEVDRVIGKYLRKPLQR
jgi:predicted transcriptional regulator